MNDSTELADKVREILRNGRSLLVLVLGLILLGCGDTITVAGGHLQRWRQNLESRQRSDDPKTTRSMG